MNPVDVDRIRSKMRNQSVVDLDAYRAASGNTADTSAIYLDPIASKWLVIGIALFMLFFFGVR